MKPQRDHSAAKFPIIQGTITPAIAEQFTYLIIVHPVSQSSVVPFGHKSSKAETANGGHTRKGRGKLPRVPKKLPQGRSIFKIAALR